eukprot:3830844-Prymnesium_polylepis.1
MLVDHVLVPHRPLATSSAIGHRPYRAAAHGECKQDSNADRREPSRLRSSVECGRSDHLRARFCSVRAAC